jgi:hypothetical protein
MWGLFGILGSFFTAFIYYIRFPEGILVTPVPSLQLIYPIGVIAMYIKINNL